MALCRAEYFVSLQGPWKPLARGPQALADRTAVIQAVSHLSIVPLVFAGIVAAALGVAIRPGDWRVLLATSGCALLAAWGLVPDWDSMRMLLFVCAFVARHVRCTRSAASRSPPVGL